MPKWLKAAGLVMAVLALAYSISRIPRPSKSLEVPPVPAEVDRIELAGPGFTHGFKKSESGWLLTAPIQGPASDEKVVSLLAGLREMSLIAVLTKRPESHGLYQVDAAGGVAVRVWARGDGQPLEWIVGKNTTDYGRVYVRRGGQDSVYLAQGLRRDMVQADLSGWRDGHVFWLKPEDALQSLAVQSGRKSFRLERSSESWTVDGKPAEAGKVERLVTEVRNLTASEFIDPPEALNLSAFGLDKPAGRVEVTLGSDVRRVVLVGKADKDEGKTALRREDSPTIYWVYSSQFTLPTTTPKDLIKP